MTDHPITPPPPHLLKKFSAQAQDETKKRNGAGYLKTFATLCIEWAMNSQLTPNDRQIKSLEIQPPPELVQDWRNQAPTARDAGLTREWWIATQAARWGADQELEACMEWAAEVDRDLDKELRAARRPKPPSLKEQALHALLHIDQGQHNERYHIIRRALEALDD